MLSSAVVSGDPVAAASAVSLQHVRDDQPGIQRLGRGKRFRYVRAGGKPVRDTATLSRIRALVIPPAWTSVWISPDPNGHIQATGRDVKGRKQYRYHAKFREVRDQAKYHRLLDLLRVLPKVRAQVERDLSCRCLCKRKVVATIVALMERGQLRVGNDEYAKQNGSYGATTLRDRHAKITGDKILFAYRGKSGIERRIELTDRRLASIVRKCRDIPGQRLFQYLDGNKRRHVTSTDVNAYIAEVTGGPFTAKDYRTWAATLSATLLLCALEHPGSERKCKACINDVLKTVAAKLGHTVAVCRKSYIHPQLFEDFTANKLADVAKRVNKSVKAGNRTPDIETLLAVEPAVIKYLAKARN